MHHTLLTYAQGGKTHYFSKRLDFFMKSYKLLGFDFSRSHSVSYIIDIVVDGTALIIYILSSTLNSLSFLRTTVYSTR